MSKPSLLWDDTNMKNHPQNNMTFQLRPHQLRMLDAMAINRKGIIQCPTGGGKTLTMITDSRRFLKPGKVVLIVAPQLLLSQQLFSEFDFHLQDIDFMWRQVSSEGNTFQRDRRRLGFRVVKPESSTTSPDEIRESYRKAQKADKPLVLFTTYASLSRVVESMVPIDVAYFDEAHNCTSSDNFRAVQFLNTSNKFFFTATPKYSEGHSPDGAGMDNRAVYGDFIARVTFDELVSQGVIVRPRIHLQKSNVISANVDPTVANMAAIVETVKHYEDNFTSVPSHKLLFCTDGTKSIRGLIDGGLVDWAKARGYEVLSIDSVNQGFANGESGISKAKFIEQLNAYGEDPNQKLIVLHYAMLGEGIDVKSFTGVVFLRRSLNSIFATQSIGRVIRACAQIGKTEGIVTIVEHEDSSQEARTQIREVINNLLEAGVPPEAFISEDDGRGEEGEEVEDLDLDPAQLIRTVVAQWEHSMLLEKILNAKLEDAVIAL